MSGPVSLRPAAPRQRFRVVEDQDVAPIPNSEAQDIFKGAWSDARTAYIDMLETLGKFPVTKLLLGTKGKPMTKCDVRAVRDAASKTAQAANEMLAALDVAVDLTKRTVPDA